MNSNIVELKQAIGEECISVIVPMQKAYPGSSQNQVAVRNAIKKAGKLAVDKYGDTALALIDKLHNLQNNIDFEHSAEGIGMYVSASIERLVQFDHPVKENVTAGNSFLFRELAYNTGFSGKYAALLLSENATRLFLGEGMHLDEVTDENFPQKFEDEFEYPHPGQFHLVEHVRVGAEEKSYLQEKRLITFFHSIEKHLHNYLAENTPLILLGPERHISRFKKILHTHVIPLAATIKGNYDHVGKTGLAAILEPELQKIAHERRNTLLHNMQEAFGAKMAVFGPADVWKAANEGNIRTLLVEKDFSFKIGNPKQLKFSDIPGNVKVADVVDAIIEKVLNKGGEVIYADNDELDPYHKIAALLRYPQKF